MMRHRRNSDFGAVPGNCCRCGCSLCGPGDLLSKKGGGGSLLASVSPLFRPRCVLHCQVPSCDFSTSDGLADFERHLYSEHRDSIVLTEEPDVLPVASALLPPTSKSAVIADLLTPYVDIKVKEEPGSGEGGATAGGGRKRRRQATRRPRKRRRDDEDDLVQDDEEEDEDYKWEDDLYGAWEEGDEDYGYEQEVEEDEGEEEDKGYFVKEPDDDSDEDGTGGRYQCNVCNYTTDDAMRMDKHAAGHTGQDVTCKYLDCDFTTDHWTNLSSHEAATHLRWIRNAFRDNTALVDSLVSLDVGNDARNSWKCRSCDHSESSKEKATLHASREHPDLVELKEVCCTDCDFISKHHKEMRDHFKKLHLAYDEQYSLPSGSGGRPRKGKPSGAVSGGIKTESREEESTCVCFTCGYKAACKRSLRLHERREHGIGGGGGDRRQREDAKPLPKAHLCDQCGYSCRTPQELGKHRENKHGFFSCHMCSYSTNKKVELTRHLRCAHKTICPECELPLSRGETLETHQCPAAMGPAEGRPELLVQLLAGTTKTKANAKINRLAGENGDGS